MIPAGHGCLGKSIVSGYRVFRVCKHVYVSWRNLFASSLVSMAGFPISMRKPGLKAVTFTYASVEAM